jgi:hypothetical protein
MFQSSIQRLRSALSRFEDILGDPPQAAPPHPHRRPLRRRAVRRAGSVPARPAVCMCPIVSVRGASPAAQALHAVERGDGGPH